MKTLLVFLLLLLLIAAAIVLDAHRLDAAGWFSAVAVAGLYAVALGDTRPRRRPRAGATPSAAWPERKTCVLCAAVSS